MSQISIRGLDTETARQLRRAAQKKGVSFNRHVLDVLATQGSKKPRRTQHDDLAHLAGTWKAADARSFAARTRSFEAIDETLWK